MKFQELMIIGNFQGILLNYLYHQKYRIIIIGLSRQKNTNIFQKVNFLGELEGNDGATMRFIAETQQKTISNFSNCNRIM